MAWPRFKFVKSWKNCHLSMSSSRLNIYCYTLICVPRYTSLHTSLKCSNRPYTLPTYRLLPTAYCLPTLILLLTCNNACHQPSIPRWAAPSAFPAIGTSIASYHLHFSARNTIVQSHLINLLWWFLILLFNAIIPFFSSKWSLWLVAGIQLLTPCSTEQLPSHGPKTKCSSSMGFY